MVVSYPTVVVTVLGVVVVHSFGSLFPAENTRSYVSLCVNYDKGSTVLPISLIVLMAQVPAACAETANC